MTDTIPLRYGWKPSRPDGRDQFFFARPDDIEADLTVYPDEFSLRPDLPEVLDQGNLGSCTANALACCLWYTMMQQGRDYGCPSRLFIYYMERLREGTITTDSGAYGRDGFHVLKHLGCPPETEWPYNISMFAQHPSAAAYDAASQGQIDAYTHARKNWKEVQHLIFKGMPVAFGFSVPACFESQECLSTGIVPIPSASEQYIGGHEVVAIGWKPGYLECRNSWGAQVMDEGNFWIPLEFVFGGYANDFRAVRL